MKNSKYIYLNSGAAIIIEDDILTCADPSGAEIHLTAGQQRLLKKLADNLNRPVTYDSLYAAYASNDQLLIYTGNANSNIAKMKRTFPDCIRRSIKNTRNMGYTLDGAIDTSPKQPLCTNEPLHITELTGNYYGYYLDPLGEGTSLGTYLHIENAGSISEPKMKAYMIFGIRNNQVLLSKELADVFSPDNRNYEEAFRNLKKALSENDKRCSWSEGMVTSDGNLAIIQLNIDNGHGKWELMIDMENYLKCTREKNEDKNYYRGGLGLVLASRTLHGTYCLRLGLIRKSFMKESFGTGHEKMIDMLKVMDGSKQAEWKPLKLSGWLDKCWYNLIMDE